MPTLTEEPFIVLTDSRLEYVTLSLIIQCVIHYILNYCKLQSCFFQDFILNKKN